MSDNDSVCWVDVDSMQIEDYPCTVGTERFRAPELHGNYGGFLRTCSHDAYALSVLLFMTLTLGLSPFSRPGGEAILPVSSVAICVHASCRGIWRVVCSNTSGIWNRVVGGIIPCIGIFCTTVPAHPPVCWRR